MDKLSKQLKKARGKTNNHKKSVGMKVVLRRRVLDAIPRARVFDAFAGGGKMFREVWHAAQAYTGCDLRWYRDARSVFVARNERVLRAIDLGDFNIFDLDAYGSPWLQVQIIAARRRLTAGERIGLVLTDGSGLKLKMGQCPTALASLSMMRTATVPGINRMHDTLITKALAEVCRRMKATIVAEWRHERPGTTEMKYLSVVLEGTAQ